GDDANLYVTDVLRGKLYAINRATNEYRTLTDWGQPLIVILRQGQFSRLTDMWGSRNFLYMPLDGTIVRISIDTGERTNLPVSISGRAIWSDATRLFVAVSGAIQTIDIATGTKTTLAGTEGISGEADGIGSAAQFEIPLDLWSDGATLFVCD